MKTVAEITKQIADIDSRLGELKVKRHTLSIELGDAKIAEATHPWMGKIVQRKKWRGGNEAGVVEVSAAYHGYRREKGDLIVRLLKKDRAPGLRVVAFLDWNGKPEDWTLSAPIEEPAA